MSMVRSWIGAAIIAISHLAWLDTNSYFDYLSLSALEGTIISLFMGAFSLALSIIIIFSMAMPGYRKITAKNLLTPLATLAIPIVAGVAVFNIAQFMTPLIGKNNQDIVFTLLQLLIGIGCFIVFIGLMCMVPTLVSHAFRAADGHPMLRPLCFLCIAAITLIAYGPLTIPNPAFPIYIAYGIKFGGPLSVILISIYEICYLKRGGVQWRLPHINRLKRNSLP